MVKGVKGEVYITNSGAKYYTDTPVRREVEDHLHLADAKAKKYEPCLVCNQPK